MKEEFETITKDTTDAKIKQILEEQLLLHTIGCSSHRSTVILLKNETAK